MGRGARGRRRLGQGHRADLRAEAQDHGRREADLEQVTGEERHEPDAERRAGIAAQQRELRDAADVDDRHAQRAGQQHPERLPADRPDQRAGHAGRHRKREQIAAGGPEQVDAAPRRPRRTPGGPGMPSAR